MSSYHSNVKVWKLQQLRIFSRFLDVTMTNSTSSLLCLFPLPLPYTTRQCRGINKINQFTKWGVYLYCMKIYIEFFSPVAQDFSTSIKHFVAFKLSSSDVYQHSAVTPWHKNTLVLSCFALDHIKQSVISTNYKYVVSQTDFFSLFIMFIQLRLERPCCLHHGCAS